MVMSEVIQYGIQELRETSNTPELDTKLILCYILDYSLADIITQGKTPIDLQDQKDIYSAIEKRKNYYPLAYITRKKEFYKHTFRVNRNVLIPRPETEELVSYVLNNITNTKEYTSQCSLLDLGTGSGCIAISLKLEKPHLEIYAADLSPAALYVAKTNAENLNANIAFFESDLLERFTKHSFDIIVANLPYVPTQYQDPSIQHEPKEALFSGNDGLQHYRLLSQQISYKKCKHLVIEVSEKQSLLIPNIFKNARDLKIVKDISGVNRIVHMEF